MAKNEEIERAGQADNGVPDDELLAEICSQDSAVALEKIIEKYSADVAGLANRLLGWPGDVDDVVQDVFLAVYLNIKKFRRQSSLKTWLFRITINKCRSLKYKRMLRLNFYRKIARKTNAKPAAADSRQMHSETSESVRRAVADLPVKYRETVVLKYLQQLSTKEITTILGITENTLNVRLSWARKTLKDKLEPIPKPSLFGFSVPKTAFCEVLG